MKEHTKLQEATSVEYIEKSLGFCNAGQAAIVSLKAIHHRTILIQR